MAIRHTYTPGSHGAPSPHLWSVSGGRQHQRSGRAGEPEWTTYKGLYYGLRKENGTFSLDMRTCKGSGDLFSLSVRSLILGNVASSSSLFPLWSGPGG